MIRIIPAIDIIDGKCVRLTQGDYNQKKVYNEDPLEVAQMFEDIGITRLHLVDLDGAKASHIVNHKTLEKIASKTSLIIDFGGGLKSDDDVRIAFESGAAMITGGSIAVKNPELFKQWLEAFGSEKIILGADAKDETIAISGWQEATNLELIPFIRQYMEQGVKKVICTDISKDGLLEGPSTDLYQKMLSELPGLELIASGGVSGMDDIIALEAIDVKEVIVGKAIYENRISMSELESFNKTQA